MDVKRIQHTTTIAETTTIEDKLFEKNTVLEEIELGLFTGFEDTTTLEDKKSMTVFSAIAVVRCIVQKREISHFFGKYLKKFPQYWQNFNSKC